MNNKIQCPKCKNINIKMIFSTVNKNYEIPKYNNGIKIAGLNNKIITTCQCEDCKYIFPIEV